MCFGVGCVRVCMWGECRACSACGVRVFTQGLCWAVQVALVPAVACACLYVCMCPRACPWGKFVPECAQGCAGAGAEPPPGSGLRPSDKGSRSGTGQRYRQQHRQRAAALSGASGDAGRGQVGSRRSGRRVGSGRCPAEGQSGWERSGGTGGGAGGACGGLSRCLSADGQGGERSGRAALTGRRGSRVCRRTGQRSGRCRCPGGGWGRAGWGAWEGRGGSRVESPELAKQKGGLCFVPPAERVRRLMAALLKWRHLTATAAAERAGGSWLSSPLKQGIQTACSLSPPFPLRAPVWPDQQGLCCFPDSAVSVPLPCLLLPFLVFP